MNLVYMQYALCVLGYILVFLIKRNYNLTNYPDVYIYKGLNDLNKKNDLFSGRTKDVCLCLDVCMWVYVFT